MSDDDNMIDDNMIDDNVIDDNVIDDNVIDDVVEKGRKIVEDGKYADPVRQLDIDWRTEEQKEADAQRAAQDRAEALAAAEELLSVFEGSFSQAGASKGDLRTASKAAVKNEAVFLRALSVLLDSGRLINTRSNERPYYYSPQRAEELREQAEAAAQAEAEEAAEKKREPNIATLLVNMAREDYQLGISDDGIPYGVKPGVPHLAMPLRGSKFSLRAELARNYFEKYQKAATSNALADAVATIEGYAAQADPQLLHLRVGERDGVIYLHTADKDDRVIVIKDGTWDYADEPVPMLFRRTELTAAMPEPVRGGDFEKFWKYANIAEEDRPLVKAHMVAAWLQPNRPRPILGLVAEHGSAKTSTARCYVNIVDPSVAPVRMCPRDPDTWVTAAAGSVVVALDNVSSIPDWLSDALCRPATGDANIRRQLFTDAQLSVVKFRRVVIITGIDLGGLNGDLADRLMPADLIRISKRLDEDELEQDWRNDRAEILGGLLDLAARVHAMLPSVVLEDKPRMADFAKVLACVDTIDGSEGLVRYRARSARVSADSVMSDPLTSILISSRYRCDGTPSSDVLAELTVNDWSPITGSKFPPEGWPKNSRSVTTKLRRHSPAMRSMGWYIENDDGKNIANTVRWTIRPPEPPEAETDRNPDSSNSSNSSSQVSGRDVDESAESDESGDESDESATSQAESLDSSENTALSREDELDESDESEFPPISVCRYCGPNLPGPSAQARGYCSKPACLEAARQQTRSR